MRTVAIGMLAACALMLAACGEPLPTDKQAYAGEWRAQNVYLLITPDGRCEYERKRGTGNVSINAPIQRFEGDNFVVGLGPFTTTFHVNKAPRLEEGKWKMTVDGVELTRTSAIGETQA